MVPMQRLCHQATALAQVQRLLQCGSSMACLLLLAPLIELCLPHNGQLKATLPVPTGMTAPKPAAASLMGPVQAGMAAPKPSAAPQLGQVSPRWVATMQTCLLLI